MPGGFTGIVMAVLGKFDAETMIRTAVQAGDESFNYLACNKINLIKIGPLFYLSKIFRTVGSTLFQQGVNFIDQSCFGNHANLFVNNLSSFEKQDGRNIPDSIFV